MSTFAFDLVPSQPPALGLIVLQTDEQIETDFRRLLPGHAALHVSRVPSGREVTAETLQEMEGHLTASARLLPQAREFDVVGYGCTSGSAQIGPDVVAQRIRDGVSTRQVTNPVTSLIAACAAQGLTRLAILSPYIESVSNRLRTVLDDSGIATPVFGSFAEAEDAKVARIAPHSIERATLDFARDADVDAVFISCTNLRAVEVTATLQRQLDMPVLCSNLVLAWHMSVLAGVTPAMLGGGYDLPATLGNKSLT